MEDVTNKTPERIRMRRGACRYSGYRFQVCDDVAAYVENAARDTDAHPREWLNLLLDQTLDEAFASMKQAGAALRDARATDELMRRRDELRKEIEELGAQIEKVRAGA